MTKPERNFEELHNYRLQPTMSGQNIPAVGQRASGNLGPMQGRLDQMRVGDERAGGP